MLPKGLAADTAISATIANAALLSAWIIIYSHSIYPFGYIDSQKQTRRQDGGGLLD
jgi:hypothetical protein